MKELLTKLRTLGHVNDLTKEMDNYLKHGTDRFYTYLFEADNPTIRSDKLYIAIRYPGATRGHIEIDKNYIITDIKLYNDACRLPNIYSDEILHCFEKYIGMKIVMEQTVKTNCITCDKHTYVNEYVITTSENKQKVIHICDDCIRFLKVTK